MKVRLFAMLATMAVVLAADIGAAQQPSSWNIQGRPISYQDPAAAAGVQDDLPPQPAQETPAAASAPPMIDAGSAPGWIPYEGEQMPMGNCYGEPAVPDYGPGSAEDVMEAGSAHVTVILPEAAKFFVNGDPTASTGETRYFVVKCMDNDQQYKFEFRAEMENAAKVKLEIKKTEMLSAGASVTLYFGGGVDACKGPWKKVEEKKEGDGAADPAAPAPAAG
jgi:uncharacterized protein (TIGR03000 family)